jgi:hypothetical protein
MSEILSLETLYLPSDIRACWQNDKLKGAFVASLRERTQQQVVDNCRVRFFAKY